MIALGGAIGTGLFIASGAAIAEAGPGALLVYLVIGLMVYFIMTSLGELATFMPVSGSFCTYASRYVDPGFGFALGWTFWFSWATVVAVDVVAAQLVMAYWFPDSPGWIWSVAFLALTFGLNAFSARGFGESEYWFALIKVIAVLCFIVVGLGMLVGIIHSGDQIGLVSWSVGDAPFVGNFATWVRGHGGGLFVPGHRAGSAWPPANPKTRAATCARAINHVFWRILLFYVLAILIIGLLIPYTDPQLLRNEGRRHRRQPVHAGVPARRPAVGGDGHERGHPDLGAVGRQLRHVRRHAHAVQHGRGRPGARLLQAPDARRRAAARAAGHHRAGLPVHVQRGLQPKAVYIWLLNFAGMTEFIVWLSIAVSHYRFRQGYVKQGYDTADLPYKAGLFPFGPLLAFVLCLLVTLGQNYQAFLEQRIDWIGVISTYLAIPLFLAFWIGHRLLRKSRWIPYADMRYYGVDANGAPPPAARS